LLLDTRAAIWLVNGDPMSADSRASITAAQRGKSRGLCHADAARGIAALVAKNRQQLAFSPEACFDALVGLAGVGLAAMPPAILIASAGLPGVPPKNPVDRISRSRRVARDPALVR